MNIVPLTGLPRSGSTLLMSILSQNSLFYTFPDSPLSDIFEKIKSFIQVETYNQQIPYQDFNKCMLNFCAGGAEIFTNTLKKDNQILLDKSRGWIRNIDFVYKTFPNLKSICIIRDLRGMVNSFEKIHNNSLSFDKNNFNYNLSESFAQQRIEYILNLWFLKDVLISIKELIELPRDYKDKIFFIKYEELIGDPKETIREIYDFLDLEYYDHDFENIVSFPCNDNVFQPYGCHTVRPKIETLKTTYSELNEESLNYILENYLWYYQEFYPEIL